MAFLPAQGSLCCLCHLTSMTPDPKPPSSLPHLDDLLLLLGCLLERGTDEPGALVVLNVGADLANDLGVAVAVQVVVLDL